VGRDSIRIGFVGYGWIARAHAHALHTLNHIAPLRRPVELVSMAGRTQERVAAAAAELGFRRWTTSLDEVADADDVDVVAVTVANEAHAPAAIAALERGKAVLCEKPLGLDAEEARAMLAAAEAAGVTHAVGFNYRYVPAVALARELVASGRIGDLRHYRALYLQDFVALGEQTRPSHGGSGAVLDYSHVVDLLRWLAGEPLAVSAQTRTFVSETEDSFGAMLDLPGGATAALEASRVATGWKGRHTLELNGSEGSLWWDMEDVNRLHVFLLADERERLGGFRDVLVTQPDHPYVAQWWPPGHVLGWEHAMVHQWRDFLEAFLDERPVPARQASFEDGCRAAVLCDAILESAREGRRIEIGEPDRNPEPVGHMNATKGRE
jgi:predicted dehydrogenase